MDRVRDDRAPVTITRSGKGQAVVLLSLEGYEQFEETAHLLRSPVNAWRLLSGVADLARGKGKEHQVNLADA